MPNGSCSFSDCRIEPSSYRPAIWALVPVKTYDIEVWLPSPEDLSRDLELLELRRLSGAADEPPVSPGGRSEAGIRPHAQRSGLAVGRTWIAILENYQQDDGSVVDSGGFTALYERDREDRLT